jgi:hypothetical protein
MTVTQLFVALNVIFAGVAIGEMVRRPRRPAPRTLVRQRPDAGLPAYVRVAEIGDQPLPAQSRVCLRILPVDAPRAAIEVLLPGSKQIRFDVADVRGVRLWLRGRPVLPAPDSSDDSLRPLAADLAAWEFETIMRDGGTLRCYGETLTQAVEQDLLRLRRLVATTGAWRRPDRGTAAHPSGPPVRPGEALRPATATQGL